jgi:hypothetical protein
MLRSARIVGGTQLRLSAVAAALASPAVGHASFPMDAEELECLTAVLIARRFVRGYLSHAPLVLVVAKERAFPRIADVAAGGGAPA